MMGYLPDLDENHRLIELPPGRDGKRFFMIHCTYDDDPDAFLDIPFAFDGPEHWRQWHIRNARELFTTAEVADDFVVKLEEMGSLDDLDNL